MPSKSLQMSPKANLGTSAYRRDETSWIPQLPLPWNGSLLYCRQSTSTAKSVHFLNQTRASETVAAINAVNFRPAVRILEHEHDLEVKRGVPEGCNARGLRHDAIAIGAGTFLRGNPGSLDNIIVVHAASDSDVRRPGDPECVRGRWRRAGHVHHQSDAGLISKRRSPFYRTSDPDVEIPLPTSHRQQMLRLRAPLRRTKAPFDCKLAWRAQMARGAFARADRPGR